MIQVRTQNILPEKLGEQIIKAIRQFQNELDRGALISIDQQRARAHSCFSNHIPVWPMISVVLCAVLPSPRMEERISSKSSRRRNQNPKLGTGPMGHESRADLTVRFLCGQRSAGVRNRLVASPDLDGFGAARMDRNPVAWSQIVRLITAAKGLTQGGTNWNGFCRGFP